MQSRDGQRYAKEEEHEENEEVIPNIDDGSKT